MTKLFWKLVAAFLVVLLLVSGITMLVTLNNANKMSMEVTQRLSRDLAGHTAETISPLLQSSDPSMALQDIMHSMMVINPGVEVYLLDASGNILNYVAPEKVVQLEKVALKPIHDFIGDPEQKLILGDDPRHPGSPNIFSVAPIIKGNETTGYIYIILASDLYASHENVLIGSYVFKTFYRSIAITVVIAFLLGIIAIYFITRQLNGMIHVYKLFKEGNLSARMPEATGELQVVATTFNDMAETISSNMEEMKGVDKLRKELISNISHDLRTPIASIHGYTELLQSKGQQLSVEEKTEYLNVVLKNIERLRKLVDDLFELSKLESQAVQLSLEPLSVQELITDLAAKYRLLAKEKGVSVNAIYSKDLPLAFADIGLLDRALQNLFDNALKFCDNGDAITIELNITDQHTINLKISDTGAGISQEALPFIFDRYYKGTDTADRTGSGLGLAITKKIIEMHGSVIQVSSRLNAGTQFSFDLPVYQ
jgi:signal transduction histidine kinase